MTPKIGLIIVHGFMNATIKNYGYDQWSLTVNVHSFIYEHRSCMINDHRHRYEHQSCMINDHRFSHEHWSSMIIDHEHNYSWSMIVAMKCYWSYMISVDQWVISWSLAPVWNQPWALWGRTSRNRSKVKFWKLSGMLMEIQYQPDLIVSPDDKLSDHGGSTTGAQPFRTHLTWIFDNNL